MSPLSKIIWSALGLLAGLLALAAPVAFGLWSLAQVLLFGREPGVLDLATWLICFGLFGPLLWAGLSGVYEGWRRASGPWDRFDQEQGCWVSYDYGTKSWVRSKDQ